MIFLNCFLYYVHYITFVLVRSKKKDKESGISRGIDFQNVSNIINFDFPPDVNSYIHRVGRSVVWSWLTWCCFAELCETFICLCDDAFHCSRQGRLSASWHRTRHQLVNSWSQPITWVRMFYTEIPIFMLHDNVYANHILLQWHCLTFDKSCKCFFSATSYLVGSNYLRAVPVSWPVSDCRIKCKS